MTTQPDALLSEEQIEEHMKLLDQRGLTVDPLFHKTLCSMAQAYSQSLRQRDTRAGLLEAAEMVPQDIPEMSVTHPDYDSHHDAYRSGWNSCAKRTREALRDAAAKLPATGYVMVPVEPLLKLEAWNKRYPSGRVYDYGSAIKMERELQDAITPIIAAATKGTK
jgi:hypothetical protein